MTRWDRIRYVDDVVVKMKDLTIGEIAGWIDDLTMQVDHLEAENARLANEIDEIETFHAQEAAGEDL